MALLAAGCGPQRIDLTLRTVPAGCVAPGKVARVIVSAIGDLEPSPERTLVLGPSDMAKLEDLPKAVHAITVDGQDDAGATVALGRSTELSFERSFKGDLSIVYAEPNQPCLTGTLTQARAGHRATLVPGGAVLITGGIGDGFPATTIELYDPATAMFQKGAELEAGAVLGHTATLLGDGTVLVAGGAAANGVARAAANRVSADGLKVTGVGGVRAARAYAAAVALAGGEVLIMGGCSKLAGDNCAAGSLLASTEVYDPATQGFRDGPTLTRARSHGQAFLRSDGAVLLVGGRVEGAEANDGELILPGSSTAVRAAVGVGALLDSGGAVMVAAEVSPAAEVALVPSPGEDPIGLGAVGVARARPTVTRLSDGDVLVVGGLDRGGMASGAADLVHVARTLGLNAVQSLGGVRAREGHTATLLGDGLVLVVGGRDEAGQARGDAELWVHSLLGPYTTLPVQDFADSATAAIEPRHHDRVTVADGVLSVKAPGRGDGGRPGEVALLPGMLPMTEEVTLSAGRGPDGAGVAVVVGWRGDGEYWFASFEPDKSVLFGHVTPTAPGKSEVSIDGGCVGEVLGQAELPMGGVAPLRVWAKGTEVQVWAGERMVLDCLPSVTIGRGMVGVGSLAGEGRFDDLVIRRR